MSRKPLEPIKKSFHLCSLFSYTILITQQNDSKIFPLNVYSDLHVYLNVYLGLHFYSVHQNLPTQPQIGFITIVRQFRKRSIGGVAGRHQKSKSILARPLALFSKSFHLNVASVKLKPRTSNLHTMESQLNENSDLVQIHQPITKQARLWAWGHVHSKFWQPP